MATKREYFIDQQRFTPSQFRRLSRARQIEAMVQWFHGRYQDPSIGTPYNGREGGFLYIHGGPYDADTEIQAEFSDLTDFETMQQAVDQVTSEGIYEWAPIDHESAPEPDEDDGIYPINMPFPDIDDVIDPPELPALGPFQSYLTDQNGRPLTDHHGNPLIVNIPGRQTNATVNGPAFAGAAFAGEAFATGGGGPIADREAVEALRREMLSRLEHLEQVVNRHTSVAVNRGHNQPPELLEVERIIRQDEAAEIGQAIASIRNESRKEMPDKELVVSHAGTLRKIAAGLLGAIGAVAGFVGLEVASAEIAILHNNHRQEVIDALMSSYHSVVAWVNLLPSAF
jgi:hypothetical protein